MLTDKDCVLTKSKERVDSNTTTSENTLITKPKERGDGK